VDVLDVEADDESDNEPLEDSEVDDALVDAAPLDDDEPPRESVL
jgi:hypothetical protein